MARSGNPNPVPRTGRPNKITKELKEMILGALDDAGGQDYLKRQAIESPGAFLSLVGKILPKDINATVDSNLTIILNKPDVSTLLDK